jgi:hypothetical protein
MGLEGFTESVRMNLVLSFRAKSVLSARHLRVILEAFGFCSSESLSVPVPAGKPVQRDMIEWELGPMGGDSIQLCESRDAIESSQ